MYLSGDQEGLVLIVRQIVAHSRNGRVGLSAAELLGRNDFSGRRLDEGRPAQEDGALVGHWRLAATDDRVVAHGRDVGPARGATAQHHGDLGHSSGAHSSDVVEDASEVISIGEDLGLFGKERTRRVDQVQTGQVALVGDFLGADFFLQSSGVLP